ncbi:aspartate-semialdehyde dehydrogenase, partial [Coemansia nantahalensis]
CLREYTCEAQRLGCHSAPAHAICVAEEEDRPQPRLDRGAGNGMSVTVGRIRECPVFHVKFTLLVHNTILGAAGSSILNAEYAAKKGYL